LEIIELTKINRCLIKNRIFRTATFEGMYDIEGKPTKDLLDYYEKLAMSSIGAIITGMNFVSKEGKTIHPGQGAIDNKEMIVHFKEVSKRVHNYGCKVFMQLSHAGRQTKTSKTGFGVVGFSDIKSIYYKEKSRTLNKEMIYFIVKKFGEAALFAKKAGFDGVQIQAAHGYLIHQSIIPFINNRYDEFGIDNKTGIGTKFLDLIIDEIRKKCGKYFTLLIKISARDDYSSDLSNNKFINLIKFLDYKEVDAIEISYGTMDFPFNIFRGKIPLKNMLKYNPMYKIDKNFIKNMKNIILLPYIKTKIKPFERTYNIEFAKLAKTLTNIPIISVGGFRSETEINDAIKNKYCDYVGVSRPFICETDFVEKIIDYKGYESKCTNCNLCVVMTDAGNKLRCYEKF
jgi:2,4-dienoyl-CoA reductase-like NADH-dependent reductase (Old Yellow Enzyme family)